MDRTWKSSGFFIWAVINLTLVIHDLLDWSLDNYIWSYSMCIRVQFSATNVRGDFSLLGISKSYPCWTFCHLTDMAELTIWDVPCLIGHEIYLSTSTKYSQTWNAWETLPLIPLSRSFCPPSIISPTIIQPIKLSNCEIFIQYWALKNEWWLGRCRQDDLIPFHYLFKNHIVGHRAEWFPDSCFRLSHRCSFCSNRICELLKWLPIVTRSLNQRNR